MKTNLCDEPWRVRLFPYEFHKTGRKLTSLQEKTKGRWKSELEIRKSSPKRLDLYENNGNHTENN